MNDDPVGMKDPVFHVVDVKQSSQQTAQSRVYRRLTTTTAHSGRHWPISATIDVAYLPCESLQRRRSTLAVRLRHLDLQYVVM